MFIQNLNNCHKLLNEVILRRRQRWLELPYLTMKSHQQTSPLSPHLSQKHRSQSQGGNETEHSHPVEHTLSAL